MTTLSIFCFTILCAVFQVLSNPTDIIQKCKLNDEECINRSAKYFLPRLVRGIPELGIETSDPMHHDEIVGDLSILKYRVSDVVVTGYSNCDVDNVKLNLDQSSVSCDLTCPNIQFTGKYSAKGRVIILPIEGHGNFKITVQQFNVGVNAEIKKVRSKDGSSHLAIKNFKFKAEAHGGATFNFENLFNGQKELADTLHKFANENWKEVMTLIQEPVGEVNFKHYISQVNKYLKTVPVEDLFLQ